MKALLNIQNRNSFLGNFSLVFCLFFLCSSLFAQSPYQTIRGQIFDQDNRQSLVGASIQLLNTDPAIGTTTDENGVYRLDGVNVGRYQMQISYLGYETILIPEILLESGKELVLDIELKESSSDLERIIVSESLRNNDLTPSSIETITVEETLRFPATFFDPARFATSFAGVVNQNDQANNIVIRGNSPNSMQWRLEGIEIVNPNHTNNAGTFSDRMTQNGGGVNILSAQLLGTSNFLTGAFPAGYGNALAGVMDMKLRKGNNERHEFMVQAGLIGIDLAAEGPLKKNGKASYLVNYRYSFTGLLGLMGITFDGEDIRFQDLAFKLHLPTEKWGQFSIFAVGGQSQNTFESSRDTTAWEFQKDRFDINFESRMGALGLTHTLPFGSQGVLKTSIIASGLESTRKAAILDNQFAITPLESDLVNRQIISFSTNYIQKINAKHKLRYGVSINGRNLASEAEDRFDITIRGNEMSTQYQPYISWQGTPLNGLTIIAGLHYNYLLLNGTAENNISDHSFEPRASLQYQLSQKQKISVAYGLHSQNLINRSFLQAPAGNYRILYEGFEFTRSHHFVLGYRNKINAAASFKIEAYYQSLFDVPISTDPNSSFSALNLIENTVSDTLLSQGTGKNYGLEFSFQKYLTNNYYILANASLYESKYTGADGIERNTRFNGNYIFNLTGGKEFVKIKTDKTRIIGLNVRAVYLGGFRDTPIDVTASKTLGETVYVETEAFSLKQKDYFKIDLRIYYKINKQKRNSTIALDIQNASNQENIAYSYYDTEQEAIVVKNQLGLIPILSYRIEF